MPPKKFSSCDHEKLVFSPSPHSSKVAFENASVAKRVAATTARGTPNTQLAKNALLDESPKPSTFPAPLILPGDELAWDPTYPGQTFRSWTQLKDRNIITTERRTIYLTGPPVIERGMEYIQKWSRPIAKRGGREKTASFPETEALRSYLEAFYHGLPVKLLPTPPISFTADVEDGDSPSKQKGKGAKSKAASTTSSTIWLNTQKASGCIGIRVRSTPKGEFSHQLNLNDLLDAAIEILPGDAYALLMLVEQDIYEDEEDDFACGRAYGGSRIAVVSGARYNPILDAAQKLERNHAWPASHCEQYMRDCCEAAEDELSEDARIGDNQAEEAVTGLSKNTALRAAVSAHANLPSLDISPTIAALSGLWLGRVCRTAAHELGHCFGIDHCVYYACSMQGTASVVEDARQPPYLCPVDLTKVLKATGANQNDRYKALLTFCGQHGETHLFAAFGAWICVRLSCELTR